LNEEINPLKIYVGWDSREDIAYQVCRKSILDTATVPVEIIPLKQKVLKSKGVYWREKDKLASTEFTFTRFLVPILQDFKGWALFIDCDFVALADVKQLFDQCNDMYAVMCAHHDYTPKEGTKMDGEKQTAYPRKNWSSMMLINCAHPSNAKLSAEFVNDPEIDGKYLHRFSWLDDSEIGKISHEWNWLVGWYKEPEDGNPKFLHYTEGGPWFDDYKNCEYSSEWYGIERQYLSDIIKGYDKKITNINDLDLTPELKSTLITFVNNMIDPDEKYHLDTKEKLMNNMKVPKAAALAVDPEEYTDKIRDSKNIVYDTYLESFVKGCNGQLSNWKTMDFSSTVPFIIRGVGGASQRALNHCIETNRDFYAIDTGYFGNDKKKLWHRITKNSLQNLGPIVDRPADRLKLIGGYRYKKHISGSTILICPPSAKVMNMFKQPSPEEWVEQTITELKKYTDKKIIIRLKPDRQDRVSTNTMEQALANDVHCLVTYNSIAATEALMHGKYAIALGPNSAQLICNTQLSEIERLRYPDEDTMDAYMRHLSYCQFNVIEMQDGTAWQILNESN